MIGSEVSGSQNKIRTLNIDEQALYTFQNTRDDPMILKTSLASLQQ